MTFLFRSPSDLIASRAGIAVGFFHRAPSRCAEGVVLGIGFCVAGICQLTVFLIEQILWEKSIWLLAAWGSFLSVGGVLLLYAECCWKDSKAYQPLATSSTEAGYGSLEGNMTYQRPEGTVSHVSLVVGDVDASIQFYEHFGFVPVGTGKSGTLLKGPLGRKGSPTLLLRQSRAAAAQCLGGAKGSRPSESDGARAGCHRICVVVLDLDRRAAALRGSGYRAVSEAMHCEVTSPPCRMICFFDPDGVLVEMVQPKGPTYALMNLMSWVQLLDAPFFYHVNVNTTAFDRGTEFYGKLGFENVDDMGAVSAPFFRAIAVSTQAKHISLLKLPAEKDFCIDFIEWEKAGGCQLSMGGVTGSSRVSLAIVVADLDRRLHQLGMVSHPQEEEIPGLGRCKVAKLTDPYSSTTIELIEYIV